ncbi:hypothetical protein [Streptomyces sp. NPDC048473]|uniref:hypothetical protein n=1 Tax=unclassified Streptomyces TaxID=2593676 RepID=UPI0037178257
MHVLDVTRDPNVGGGQGLVVLDVESDADLTGCPDCGVVAVGHGRHVQSLHDAPPFGTPVRVRWRKRIWRHPEPLVTADCVIAPGGLRIRDTATGVTASPGCCFGLKNWRDWLDLMNSEEPWLGHDPAPHVERVGAIVRLWPDGDHPEGLPIDYDNHKSHRKRRRLPIAAATAALITKQQVAVRTRFPDTPAGDLVLLPTQMRDPHGAEPISESLIATWHRTWVTGLPDFHLTVTVDAAVRRTTEQILFDKARIFLYAYRHSYAQRHADAGVAPDVLKELMDHRQLSTTQGYYRVGEKRRREAVDRVTAMQFDRHGNRIWRQAQLLLDSGYARRSIGEVAVPHGLCTEPSNVAAGGHDCPSDSAAWGAATFAPTSPTSLTWRPTSRTCCEAANASPRSPPTPGPPPKPCRPMRRSPAYGT